DATLGWWPGSYAVSHDLYFGTTSPPALVGNTTEFSFAPEALVAETTYYWRVDAVEADGTIRTGDIWTFATVLDIPVTDPNLLVWWTFDEDAGDVVIDHSGHSRYGAVNGTTWVADGKVGGAMDFSGGGDDVVDDDAGYLNGLSAITFAAWIKSDVTNTDKGFIICEDPEGNDSHDMRYDKAGATAGGTDLLKMAVTSTGGEQQIESSSGLQTTEWQHCAMVWSSGEQLKFYVNGVLDTPMANSTATTGTTTGYTKLIAGKGKDGNSSAGWDGLIDDLRVYDIALSENEVRALAGLAPIMVARSPDPADGATDVPRAAALSWQPAASAVSHNVYLSTDQQAVIDSTALIGNQAETSYTPAEQLAKGATYYWRIDEVEADGTTHTGDLWSFTVTSIGR
ncbi:MAG: LamG domain-containing protein, partial [Phycisphaerales bacterium]